MVDPALAQLRKLVLGKTGEGVRLGAIKDVLDRAGFAADTKVSHDGTVEVVVTYKDEKLT
jgi:hypothetical protein